MKKTQFLVFFVGLAAAIFLFGQDEPDPFSDDSVTPKKPPPKFELVPKNPPKKTAQGVPLITHTYIVPPTFLGNEYGQRPNRTAQEVLEGAGVQFPPEGSAHYNPVTDELTVQMEIVEIYIGPGPAPPPKAVTVIHEAIEVEAADYANWLFENRISDTSTTLRRAVQDWKKAGKATIVRTTIVNSRSGQRASTFSVREDLRPAEFGADRGPEKVNLSGNREQPLISPGTPGSKFETLHVGTNLEVDPVLGADNAEVDLNLSVEFSSPAGTTEWPPESLRKIPKIHVENVITQISMHQSEYVFLGTTRPKNAANAKRKRPLILNFIRADVGVIE